MIDWTRQRVAKLAGMEDDRPSSTGDHTGMALPIGDKCLSFPQKSLGLLNDGIRMSVRRHARVLLVVASSAALALSLPK